MPLYIPGHIIHLLRTHNAYTTSNTSGNNSTNSVVVDEESESTRSNYSQGCCTRPLSNIFIPIEAHCKDMGSIYISPTMVWDHLPDRYVNELLVLRNQFNI